MTRTAVSHPQRVQVSVRFSTQLIGGLRRACESRADSNDSRPRRGPRDPPTRFRPLSEQVIRNAPLMLGPKTIDSGESEPQGRSRSRSGTIPIVSRCSELSTATTSKQVSGPQDRKRPTRRAEAGGRGATRRSAMDRASQITRLVPVAATRVRACVRSDTTALQDSGRPAAVPRSASVSAAVGAHPMENDVDLICHKAVACRGAF